MWANGQAGYSGTLLYNPVNGLNWLFIPLTTDATKDICGIMVGFHEYNLMFFLIISMAKIVRHAT